MRSIKVKKVPAIAVAGLLPILLALGFWQLDRAEQKQQLAALQEQRRQNAILTLTGKTADNVDDFLYQTVRVEGTFDNSHPILQNNQIRQGKTGFFVFTPFRINNSAKAILINRGWIPDNKDQKQFPDLGIDQAEREIVGSVNRFYRPGIVLPGADKPNDSWPVVVQVINSSAMEKKLGYALFDFQIELANAYPFGFQRDWQHPVIMPPEKHIAYAVQWFLLAGTLLVLFIIYGIEKE